MTPFLFGAPERRLFGLHHASEAPGSGDSAVLLCNPFGQEAIRTHRLLRVLAERLSKSGADVLRFDLYGSGDSAGDDEDGDLQGWCEDVLAAHDELRRRSQAARITWLGVRLGATLALQAARDMPSELAHLVLWDPVVDGAAYLQHLRERHVDALEASYSLPDPAWRRHLIDAPDAYADEAIGFGLSQRLRDQLAGVTAASLHLPAGLHVQVIADPADTPAQRWLARQTEQGARLTWVPLAHGFDWTVEEAQNTALVPASVLTALMNTLAG
jgi:uncharacterized protein